MNDNDSQDDEQISYPALNTELLRRLPQLRKRYAELQGLWGEEEPGPHVVYGDVLVPYLIESLTEAPDNSGLTAAFAFLEDLLGVDNQEIRDLVGASVLEDLYDVPGARTRAKQHMGPATRRLAEQIGAAWS
jgi:hypothetical protein